MIIYTSRFVDDAIKTPNAVTISGNDKMSFLFLSLLIQKAFPPYRSLHEYMTMKYFYWRITHIICA